MRGFRSVRSQEDLDNLWEAADGFLDAEIVDLRFSKVGEMLDRSEPAGLRIFLRCTPRIVEIVAAQVAEICLESPWWISEDVVEKSRFYTDRVSGSQRVDLELPWGRLRAWQLFWRTHDRHTGLTRLLLSEVPRTDMVQAKSLRDGWRQCSACADAWLDPAERIYCFCPSCEALTELVDGSQ